MLKRDNAQNEFLGVGLYAVQDAARLLRMPARNIRRWLGGYNYSRGEVTQTVPPLWKPDLPTIDGQLELSFRDLIEVRFVNAFIKSGVGLKAIRNCLDYAQDVVQSDRPFSTSRFLTDGKTIFLESIEREADEDPKVLDLKRHQYVFAKVIERSFKDLDLKDDEVTRWRPYGGKESVVIDPQRSFGQPIIADYGVPTVAIAQAVEAEGSLERVANIYEMPVGAVRDAVKFEQELQAA